MITTLLRQPLEVGELSLFHETIGEVGILPVEPHDDQAFDLRLGFAPVTNEAPRNAERVREQRKERQHHGGEHHQEGRQEGDAGARADVGGGGRGCREQQHDN